MPTRIELKLAGRLSLVFVKILLFPIKSLAYCSICNILRHLDMVRVILVDLPILCLLRPSVAQLRRILIICFSIGPLDTSNPDSPSYSQAAALTIRAPILLNWLLELVTSSKLSSRKRDMHIRTI